MENYKHLIDLTPKYDYVQITHCDAFLGKYGVEGCVYWKMDGKEDINRVCGIDLFNNRRIQYLFVTNV